MASQKRFLLHVLHLSLVLGVLATLSSCSSFVFVEDRLDPPRPGNTGVTFQYKAPAARQVNVAGEFNNWMGTANGSRLDPNIDPLADLDGDGIWEITLPLPPGRYQYKYVIDQVDWQKDPANPEQTDDGFGGLNSILVVPADVGYEFDEAYVSYSLGTSSRLKRSYDYSFSLAGYADASAVYVTGDWTNWDPQAVPLTLGGDGVWKVTTQLTEGDHTYKFNVDGEWLADPENPDRRDDGYGGENSVANARPSN